MKIDIDNTQLHYLLILNTDRQKLLRQAISPSSRLQSADVEYGISIDIEQLLIDALTEAGESV